MDSQFSVSVLIFALIGIPGSAGSNVFVRLNVEGKSTMARRGTYVESREPLWTVKVNADGVPIPSTRVAFNKSTYNEEDASVMIAYIITPEIRIHTFELLDLHFGVTTKTPKTLLQLWYQTSYARHNEYRDMAPTAQGRPKEDTWMEYKFVNDHSKGGLFTNIIEGLAGTKQEALEWTKVNMRLIPIMSEKKFYQEDYLCLPIQQRIEFVLSPDIKVTTGSASST